MNIESKENVKAITQTNKTKWKKSIDVYDDYKCWCVCIWIQWILIWMHQTHTHTHIECGKKFSLIIRITVFFVLFLAWEKSKEYQSLGKIFEKF